MLTPMLLMTLVLAAPPTPAPAPRMDAPLQQALEPRADFPVEPPVTRETALFSSGATLGLGVGLTLAAPLLRAIADAKFHSGVGTAWTILGITAMNAGPGVGHLLAGDWLSFVVFTGLRGLLFAGTVALAGGPITTMPLAVFTGLSWTVVTVMEFVFFLRDVPARWSQRQRSRR